MFGLKSGHLPDQLIHPLQRIGFGRCLLFQVSGQNCGLDKSRMPFGGQLFRQRNHLLPKLTGSVIGQV
ncbi:hypothetical protein FPY71_08725 [Aureimonas fodinaquatilis]|uniref:Uncharacterized protein n=1 Tax=Aureimonas fodinaquatilis TaxID=2565783 RepID=A0A5B0DVW8_9HYPH|nr:hypothetical protein [Aureimonas fodinaquatilis]KAA0970573.1 hypothetical protein FPY71_08725 [Aureimonas fodinaquatilis]